MARGYKPVDPALLVGFDEFWAAYPNKQSKGDAKKAWAQVRATELGLLPKILAALAWQRRSHAWTKDGGEFIPYPATWLRAEGWENEPPKPLPKVSEELLQDRERTRALLESRRITE